jgi:hypothetical protein
LAEMIVAVADMMVRLLMRAGRDRGLRTEWLRLRSHGLTRIN